MLKRIVSERKYKKRAVINKKIAGLAFIVGSLALGLTNSTAYAVTARPISLPFSYDFSYAGQLDEAGNNVDSSSPYWWVKSGARLIISNGVASTIQGNLPPSSPWYKLYAVSDPGGTDKGTHPQNKFVMLMRSAPTTPNTSVQVYFNRVKDNLSNYANRHEYNGEAVITRYQNNDNYYFATIRADGYVVIKKKINGTYKTLASKKVFAGTYNATTAPDLIPLNKWIGLKLVAVNSVSGAPTLSAYTDIGKTGTWQLATSAYDDPIIFGPAISSNGLSGVQSDYADAQFDNFLLTNADAHISEITATTTLVATTTPTAPLIRETNYDSLVLLAKPIMYLTMSSPSSGKETDISGNGNNGTYKGPLPNTVSLPNGDKVASFNGINQYLTVPSSPKLSIPTKKILTWEAWIRPDTLQFANANSDGYIDWMGKCQNYSPTCEWEARMYSTATSQNRPSRISAYVFNPSAGLGSAADWQPRNNVIKAGEWIHVVAQYQTITTPSGCLTVYPGSINIWVNGVKQNLEAHLPTGCMSQFKVIPKAGTSPLNIGTMSFDTWFKGAIGKVAIYDRLLTQTEISAHYTAMTGKEPTGSCAGTCSF